MKRGKERGARGSTPGGEKRGNRTPLEKAAPVSRNALRAGKALLEKECRGEFWPSGNHGSPRASPPNWHRGKVSARESET